MLSQSAKRKVRGMANFEIKDDQERNILNSTYTAAYSYSPQSVVVWMKILVT